jgi:phage terminase small subunit
VTPKQERFVEEYLIDLNATQAAIRAGYSEKTAYAIGEQNLRKLEVATAIAARRAVLTEVAEVTQERIVREYAKLGFSKVSDIIAWGSREVQIGFDADGKRLSPDQIEDAVMVRSELAPYVDAIPSDQLSEAALASVSEVALTKDGLRIKLHDKRAALQDLGRHLGMFVDRHEHKVDVTLRSLILESMGEVIEGEVVRREDGEDK